MRMMSQPGCHYFCVALILVRPLLTVVWVLGVHANDASEVDVGPSGWHGPRTAVVSSGGRPMLSVAGALQPPLWFVGHGDLSNTTARGRVEMGNFYTQVNASIRAGFDLVEILTDQWERASTRSGVSDKTTQTIDGILRLNPKALFILRPTILPAVEPSVVMCKGNASTTTPSSLTTPASTQWLAKAKAGLLPFIKAVDVAYPGRIAGVHLTGMSTGEWMWPGAGSTGDPPNASATCDGMGTGQINDYADYSQPMHAKFCAALNRSLSSCELATPAERDLPRTGNSFVCGGWNEASASARVVRQNMLLAQVMADAVGGLAEAVKKASDHKALVLTFFGYVLHCTTDRHGSNSRNLVNSGHLAGSSLVANRAIDGFVGTYSYSPNTRNVSMPLLPAGEYSSLWKQGKLWIIEDDTRTHLCPSDQVYGGWPLKWCHSLSDTKSILRRNYLSASMLSHGSYLFDLEAQGWFGQATDPATADAIWQTMGDAVKAVERVNVTSGPLPSHQVAVFFDEVSAATQPLDSRLVDTHNASSRTISGDYTLHNSSLELAGIGTSFEHYYLTDLPTLDVSSLRFVVFLNAFAPSEAIRMNIVEKFRGSNATLLFLGPAGIIELSDTTCTANGGGVANFTGIDGLTSLVGAPHPAHTTVAPTALASALFPGLSDLRGMRFGQPEPVAPRFYWQAPSENSTVHVLGRYAGSDGDALLGQPSLVSTELLAGYRSIFSGASALPATLLRVFAKAAGVHCYADCSHDHDCTIHAAGNALLIHAGSRSGTRELTLPEPLLVEDETGAWICKHPCQKFQVTLKATESRLFYLQRILHGLQSRDDDLTDRAPTSASGPPLASA